MTIHELAKELNLSAATVSLALKGDTRIAEATRRRVLDQAKTRGYRVNEQARNLRLGRSGLVALVVHNIASDFWAGTVGAIEDALGEEYSVLVCNSCSSLEKERRILDNLVARRIDSVIIQPAKNGDISHLVALNNAGTPVVLLERTEEESLSFVKAYDYSASEKAFKTLQDSGHSKIAMLSISIPGHIGIGDREQGFLAAATGAGLERTCKIIQIQSPYESGIHDLFMPQAKDFSAVACIDDCLIVPLLSELGKAGIDCPGEMSLLCWNNRAILDALRPPISRFDIPVGKMGRTSAEFAKRLLQGEKGPLRDFIEEPFILRESIAINRRGI